MNSSSPIRLLVFSCLPIVVMIANLASAQPSITVVTPSTGASGTGINIFGTGFTGVDRVLFINRVNGSRADSAFSALSDTQVSDTVPADMGSQWLVSLFTPLGGTVTIPTDFFSITSSTSGGQGSAVYVVSNGGSLTGGFGSSTVFVESGGSYDNTGGGGGTVFVQQGGTYNQGGGGSSLIFYEPGATIAPGGGGGGNIFTQVPDLQPSFQTVPEPSTIAFLLPVGIAFLTFRHRSIPRRSALNR